VELRNPAALRRILAGICKAVVNRFSRQSKSSARSAAETVPMRGVFDDTAEEGRMLGRFLEESWLEHLRQHERVAKAERSTQEAVQRFDTAGTPKVTHLIART
jgi:hypothetical protein